MPRLQLTDEEATLIADLRRKNETRLAVEKAIDWCHDYLIEDSKTESPAHDIETLAADMLRIGRALHLVEPRRKRS